jgi:hypothetical protein
MANLLEKCFLLFRVLLNSTGFSKHGVDKWDFQFCHWNMDIERLRGTDTIRTLDGLIKLFV